MDWLANDLLAQVADARRLDYRYVCRASGHHLFQFDNLFFQLLHWQNFLQIISKCFQIMQNIVNCFQLLKFTSMSSSESWSRQEFAPAGRYVFLFWPSIWWKHNLLLNSVFWEIFPCAKFRCMTNSFMLAALCQVGIWKQKGNVLDDFLSDSDFGTTPGFSAASSEMTCRFLVANRTGASVLATNWMRKCVAAALNLKLLDSRNEYEVVDLTETRLDVDVQAPIALTAARRAHTTFSFS